MLHLHDYELVLSDAVEHAEPQRYMLFEEMNRIYLLFRHLEEQQRVFHYLRSTINIDYLPGGKRLPIPTGFAVPLPLVLM